MSLSFAAFLANGDRNSPGLSGCYGLCLDGTKLVSGHQPLGSPGRKVMGRSHGCLFTGLGSWPHASSSSCFFVLSLKMLPCLSRGKARYCFIKSQEPQGGLPTGWPWILSSNHVSSSWQLCLRSQQGSGRGQLEGKLQHACECLLNPNVRCLEADDCE